MWTTDLLCENAYHSAESCEREREREKKGMKIFGLKEWQGKIYVQARYVKT